MSREKEKFIAELGELQYATPLALYRWSMYLLLGKLSSTIYVLKKENARQVEQLFEVDVNILGS